MPGLDPDISLGEVFGVRVVEWMAGTSPAMTIGGLLIPVSPDHGAVHRARFLRQDRAMDRLLSCARVRLFSRARVRATQRESERVTASKMDGRAVLSFRACDPFAACVTLDRLGPLASDHLGPLWATLGRSRPE